MLNPQIHIFRHHNKVLVDQFMENFHSELDPRKNLSYQTSINPAYLKVMRALAGMREAADRSEMGFFGAFITPEGYHYSISNIENVNENQFLDVYLNFEMHSEFQINDFYKKLRIVQTKDGIQLRLDTEL